MRFSFCVMAVAVQAYWAWQFAAQGNEGDSSFWLLVALWASFGSGLRLQRGAALTTWGRPEQ